MIMTNAQNNNIRFYIYTCLYNIYFNGAYSNIEVDHVIRENGISQLDAKLLTNVVYGTISHNNILSWEIDKLSDKKPKDEAKIILLMSLYQMHYLDKVPDFAVINEAVSIAKKVGGEPMGKFVNAILRASQRENIILTMDDCKDEYEFLSLAYNMPVWVLKMLERHYGKQVMMDYLDSCIQEAPLTVRVNIHKANKDDILDNNPDFEDGFLANNSLIYHGDDLFNTKEFKEGLVSIQDESSQYVVEVLDPQENERVLDMCAAPGSKTQYIAELMNNTGKVLALDIHPHRVAIMKKYLQSLGLTNVYSICYDSTKLFLKEKLLHSFDRVLLDAPCLGLGVVRRKPDIMLKLNSDTLDEIAALQEKLLEQAYIVLKNGGTLVYSTCSINKKENNSQISLFLSRHPDMEIVFEKQIFPFDYNSDGFYICKMVKK